MVETKTIDWSDYWHLPYLKSHYICRGCSRHLTLCCNNTKDYPDSCSTSILCMFWRELEQ